jgi:hypothetical protein
MIGEKIWSGIKNEYKIFGCESSKDCLLRGKKATSLAVASSSSLTRIGL